MRYAMKKSFIIIVCFALLSTLMYAQLQHTLTFDVSNVSFSKIDSFDLLSYKNTHYLEKKGEPRLPIKEFNLIIPPGMDIASIHINTCDTTTINGSYYIYPAQGVIPTKLSYLSNNFTPPNPSIYNSNNPYPSQPIKLLHTGYFDGNRIAHFQVCPIRYIPKNRKVIFLERISFTIQFNSSSNSNNVIPV